MSITYVKAKVSHTCNEICDTYLNNYECSTICSKDD